MIGATVMCPRCGGETPDHICRRCDALAGDAPEAAWPERSLRSGALRSVADADDDLREALLRWLGAVLAFAGGALVVSAFGSTELARLVPIDLLRWALVAPGVMGMVLWWRPRAQLLVVPIAIVAWLTALGVGAGSALDVFLHDAEGGMGGTHEIRGLADECAVLGAPILLIAALACAIDPTRGLLARWAWVAAVTWSVPFALEATISWAGHRSAIRWLAATELSARSVQLFAFGCAACSAVFLAIERHPPHRRWLGGACLVAMALALASLPTALHREWGTAIALRASWVAAMAISLVPFIDVSPAPRRAAAGAS